MTEAEPSVFYQLPSHLPPVGIIGQSSKPQGVPNLFTQADRGNQDAILEPVLYFLGRDLKPNPRLCSRLVFHPCATLAQPLGEGSSPYYQIDRGDLKGNKSANGLTNNGRKLAANDLADNNELIVDSQSQSVCDRPNHQGSS